MSIHLPVVYASEPKQEDLFRLSVSKAKTFKDCKAKYKYQYIEKLPRKEWEHFAFGNFIHIVLETFHKDLSYDKDLPNLMTESFKVGMEEYGEKLTKENKLEAHNLLKNYLKNIAKEQKNNTLPNIVATERGFYVGIGNLLLNGFIDRIQKDPDDVLHVADYKTTKLVKEGVIDPAKYRLQKLKYLKKDFFQLMTYAYVLMLEDKNLEKIRTSYIVIRDNFSYITKEFTREEVMSVQDKFIEYAEQISQEKLWAPSVSPLCAYCDYMNAPCKDGYKYLVKTGKIEENINPGFGEW